MNSETQIVKGVYWTTIVNIVNAIYNFFAVPLLIVYFGKDNYGLIGIAISVNVYLRLIDIGFNSTIVRFFSNWLAQKEYNNVTRLFQTSLFLYSIVGIINASLLFFISIFSAQMFHLDGDKALIMKHLLYIVAISSIFNWVISCFEQIIRSFEHIGWLQRLLLLPKFIQIIILIYTISIPNTSIEFYYCLTAFSMCSIIPFTIIHIKKYAPYLSFIPSFDKEIFKLVIPYCLNILSFGIFQFSINYLRPVFLGMNGNLESVTDYRILNAVITLVLLIGGSFLSIILPASSKSVATNNIEAQKKITYTGTKYITLVLSLMSFGIISISPTLLYLYVGADYVHLSTWLDLWLLTTLFSHNQGISSLILSRENIRAITYITIISATIGLILCWFLIPIFQVGGTIIAYAIYGLIQILFYYIYYWPRKMGIDSYKVFKYSFLPPTIVGILGCAIARVVRSFLLEMNQWSIAIITFAVFLTVYTIVCYIFILTRADRKTFLLYIKLIIKQQ